MTETEIYHVYNIDPAPHEPIPMANSAESFTGKFTRFLNRLAFFLALIGIFLITFAFLPEIDLTNFRLSGKEVDTLSVATEVKKEYQPAFNPALPRTNRIVISSIGVDSQIVEGTYENYEDALRNGIWRVSDFGAPNSRQMPTIFAAHRYGYLAWTNSFRRESSFYNLPKLKVGDTVIVIWQQRKYTYEIYGESKGTEITDYSADMILYTCESLTGPVRIFKYARLLEI